MYLGIDLGTTNFKFGLVNPANGSLDGLSRIPIPVEKHGRNCEIIPAAFWQAVRNGISDVCSQAGIKAGAIQAMSYSSQANSFIVLNYSDEPLTPIILWPDERVEKVTDNILTFWDNPAYKKITGAGFRSPRMCISKISSMLLDGTLSKRNSRIKILSISDYLTYSLTNRLCGDAGTSSLLGIMDFRTLTWWQEALDTLCFDQDWFPELVRPGILAGTTEGSAAVDLGLDKKCLFIAGSLDHHMGSLGTGAGGFSPYSESTGTVLAAIELSDTPELVPGGVIGPHINEGEYFRLAFNSNGGSVLEWYRNKYANSYSFDQLNKLAEKAVPGTEGLRAKPYADTYAGLSGFLIQGGSISGLTEDELHGLRVRAIMESTGASLYRLFKELAGTRSMPEKIMATGGGAGSTLWKRIKSSVTGSEICTTSSSEPACYGACINAASVHMKIPAERLMTEWLSVKETIKPDPNERRFYQKWMNTLDLEEYR